MLKGLKNVLDIDGTLFYHRVPELGKPLPGIEYIKNWVKDGAIINTLDEAINALNKLGIPYHSIYKDKGQEKWTSSPKCYGHVIVDDTCCGIPLGKD